MFMEHGKHIWEKKKSHAISNEKVVPLFKKENYFPAIFNKNASILTLHLGLYVAIM